jgi:hypothetical protein
MALAYDDGRDLNLLVMGSLSWVRLTIFRMISC